MTIEPIRVTVFGCGGIGSWFAEGIGRQLRFQAPGSILQLVDGDNFEEKNAERQSFVTMGNKAHAKRNDMQPYLPNVFVVAHSAWIVSDEVAGSYDNDDEDSNTVQKVTAQSLMQDGDFVFAVFDNFAARKLVFDAAQRYDNIDVFTGGNGSPDDGDGFFGTVYHYQRRNGVDTSAHPAEYHDEYLNPPDRNTGELSCSERAKVEGGTQLVAVNMAVASVLLTKSSQIIFGTEQEKAEAMIHTEIYFNLSSDPNQFGMISSNRKPVKATVQV